MGRGKGFAMLKPGAQPTGLCKHIPFDPTRLLTAARSREGCCGRPLPVVCSTKLTGRTPMLAVKIIALWALLSLLGPSSCQGDRLNGSTIVSTMR